ncbi:MAG: hypothetical protein GXO74_05350 [Calditrichaeota bacterium]|nr:hypothetical protein [Calditrichota bacterium]
MMKLLKLTSILVFILLFSPLILSAGDVAKINHPVSVEVSVAMTRDGMTPLNQKLLDSFRKALVAKGFVVSGDGDFRFFLDAKAAAGDKNDLVAVSTFTQNLLPPKIVQFCADQEVFYKLFDNYSRKKYPKDGKFVREYVTTDFLKQYGRIIFNDLSVVSQENLDSVCSDILDRFLQKTNNQFHLLPQK